MTPKAEQTETPWPKPGQVGIIICGEDGAQAWVTGERSLFEQEPGMVAQLLPFLDEAQQMLREQHPKGA
jgi:hypothetical protein